MKLACKADPRLGASRSGCAADSLAMTAAIFIDKDGTLVDDVPYNVDPGKVRLAHGAFGALAALRGAGYRLVVVTNQSGIARGLIDDAGVQEIGRHLAEVLAAGGIPLDGYYYCPHHPDGSVEAYSVECDCRKPAPGLIHRAAADLGLDVPASWMIGDIAADIDAGIAAGCRTALVNDLPERELPHVTRPPDVVARTLSAAAEGILALRARVGARVQPS
jgi:D-glycero-D-manno-heptose 1,7-bisphosphate phosphatase